MDDTSVKIEYENEPVYDGPLSGKEFQCVCDLLLSDALKRSGKDRFHADGLEATIRDASFGYYGWLLVTIAVTASARQPMFYVYIVQGKKPVLEPFLSWLSAIPNFGTRWEFRIACIDADKDIQEQNLFYGLDLYRGPKLALTECAAKIYRHALIRYAETSDAPEKTVSRTVRVKACEGEHLSLEVSYNKISSIYSLSGPAAYIYELDCYFKGVYDDFEAMLKAGRIASATVCSSIDEMTEAFIDKGCVLFCLWFPFKMDGNLEGTYGKLENPNQIYEKAARFIKLCVPDTDVPPEIKVEYVCNQTDRIIIEKARSRKLCFEYENRHGPSGPPVFALEVYAKAYANGEHIITYRYQVQDRLPIL